MDLVRATQRVVDPAHDVGNGISGIQRLVRIHLPREVRIPGDLPAGEVDGVETGAHLLHGLVAV